MAGTVTLLIACAMFARRSRLAGLVVVPIVIAGCVIAVDVAHAAALAKGKFDAGVLHGPAAVGTVTTTTGPVDAIGRWTSARRG